MPHGIVEARCEWLEGIVDDEVIGGLIGCRGDVGQYDMEADTDVGAVRLVGFEQRSSDAFPDFSEISQWAGTEGDRERLVMSWLLCYDF